ncbi:FkbM family methyltransferase [Roseomonas terrae]|jgi:FkbM family methyltransferase|uniref:FkbM family methyltransferase n=1 Tax=Neoroseomonas terrae TaxID=424799 RepID=A0ABS5EKN9_9PROT|nr:FkbM family methyltransferase [Neoroseomonas terrae]MBR0651584.1 FkbM family methyltransferase [Neoroseomonas terrae]
MTSRHTPMPSPAGWVPPSSIEERLRSACIPPRLALRWDLFQALRRGERELHLVPSLADRSRTSIDVGANRGVWTEMLRRHSRSVLAFEPNPKLFRELSRRLGRGASALPYALSDCTGEAELRVPRRRRGYSNQGATLAHDSLGEGAYGALTVSTRRLDEIDTGDVGFIKIDVEGHEFAVLRGAAGLIARCRPVLVIEMEEKHLHRPIAGAIAEVAAYGYRPHYLQAGQLVAVQEAELPRLHGPNVPAADYVFNWIFLPA